MEILPNWLFVDRYQTYYFDTEKISKPNLALYSFLSPKENLLLVKRRNDNKRREFALSRYVIKLALGFNFSQFTDITIAYAVAEKSGLVQYKNKTIYSISLSHSGNHLAFVIGQPCDRLGIDVEQKKLRDFKGLAKSVFCGSDVNQIEHAKNTCDEFYTLWTAKEAVSKIGNISLHQALKTNHAKLKAKHHMEVLNNDNWVLTVVTEKTNLTKPSF